MYADLGTNSSKVKQIVLPVLCMWLCSDILFEKIKISWPLIVDSLVLIKVRERWNISKHYLTSYSRVLSDDVDINGPYNDIRTVQYQQVDK